MPSIDNAPIIKAWAEDTSNKDAPSQTAIGTGIEYASPLVSSEPNGALYLIFKAAKYLQRTGGMYSATTPYIRGQSCSLLCVNGTRYEIRRFICDSATDITNTPPLTGATITDVNGVSCYSGGVLSTSWQDADGFDGYAQTSVNIPEGASASSIPAFGVINSGRFQYYNPSNNSLTNIPPMTSGDYMLKSPTLDEALGMMYGIWYPPYLTQATDVSTYPLRRLGAYWFHGTKVEAFGMFLSGQGFSDNGTSNNSKFWRSFDSGYTSLCVCARPTYRDQVFSGTAGDTITTRDYRGRVPVCVGTATLTSGTSEVRAALGGVQDDQMQGHAIAVGGTKIEWAIGVNVGSAMSGVGNSKGASSGFAAQTLVSDGVNGTPRIGYNTREATYSVPVPMVVSLLPYGEITL